MSEYQYYEFLAIDRPLDSASKAALRSISSRARITTTSFTNHYEWGDFKGDPRKCMEQWFDLHLYLTNWGSRRLMMRLPGHLVDREAFAPFLRDIDWAEVWSCGDNLVVDLFWDEGQAGDEWDDGSGWLAQLAPLRADVIAGDLKLFYLVWLTAVQEELVPDEAIEPLPGIGALTGALEAFAAFYQIDSDLVRAAAESGAGDAESSEVDLRGALAAISESEKTKLLLRVLEGDSHVAGELKRRIRSQRPAPALPRRTVGALRARAREIAEARERLDAERREAERRRQAKQAEKEHYARLQALKQRGAVVWREVEAEIERRNAAGYDRAASLLGDLQILAAEEESRGDFDRRLAEIRARHRMKGKFIERLATLACSRAKTAS
jgi:hypothetical protein